MKNANRVGSWFCVARALTLAASVVVACDLKEPGLTTSPDAGAGPRTDASDEVPIESGARAGNGGTGASGGVISNGGAAQGGSGGAAGSAGQTAQGGLTGSGGRASGGASSDGGRDGGLDASNADACAPRHANCGGASSGCGTDLDNDPQHCGACGHACLGGDCQGGVCQALQLVPPLDAQGFSMPPVGFPKALAVDGTHVYWSLVRAFGATDSGIYACPITGCGGNKPAVLFPSGEPQSITVAASAFYWSDGGSSRMVTCPLSGCGANPTACASNQPAPAATATDGAYIYWTNQGTAANASTDGAIMKASIANPATCGASESLATPPRRPADLALDGGTLYWIVDPSTPTTADGALFSCPVSGCNQTPTTVVPSLLRPVAMAASGGSVYWASGSTNTTGQCTTDGAVYACTNCKGVPKSIYQNTSCPAHLAADADYVYWIETDANGYSSRVKRVHGDGSGAETFAESPTAILNIALDEKAVYWLKLGGEVYKQIK